MLIEMRETRLARRFVGGTHMIPDGDRDLGRAAILVDDDAQAIGQRELLEEQHLVGVRGLDERKRRGRGRQQEAGTDHKEKLLSYLRGKPGRLVRDKNSRPEGKWTAESDGDAGLDAAAAARGRAAVNNSRGAHPPPPPPPNEA